MQRVKSRTVQVNDSKYLTFLKIYTMRTIRDLRNYKCFVLFYREMLELGLCVISNNIFFFLHGKQIVCLICSMYRTVIS